MTFRIKLSKIDFDLGIYQSTYCTWTAVHRRQVDSPQLRHTSSLGKCIVRLYSRTDDFDMLQQQTHTHNLSAGTRL